MKISVKVNVSSDFVSNPVNEHSAGMKDIQC